jgi:hypothetical protein
MSEPWEPMTVTQRERLPGGVDGPARRAESGKA